MIKLPLSLLSLLLTAVFVMAPFQDAEAKRFGGGRSFGGRPLYSMPYKRSAIPKKPLYNRQQAAQRQATAQRNQAARQSWRNRGGLLGMLAPFLIGGLLGALFFGGAFEHINLADILVLGGLAFLAFKLLARRPQPAAESPYGGSGYDPGPDASPTGGFRATESAPRRPFDTDLLFGRKGARTVEAPPPELPADFDVDAFLEEAKSLFLRLQEAWNRGEMADIRALTTDEVFMEIKDQWQQEDSGEPTEVLELDAQLLDYRRDEDGEEAAVLFTALLREGRHPPEQIEEIWHFVRPRRQFNAGWRLDGIQQVED
ncbi:hypothetical protein MIT9_P0942 [Methylomarinovum caldicuralii]|uniref:Tim44-like domain-containing protein n=1 Tax=Methylomarinovum caldicuralii TaxID=438856 RepID=A0AAU9CA37_9GAMM|nr:TIM44-like domain-containing protein [Methylomarinovum caldicuralii]BCX81364.1 hypothetical protein MIT9_P0942 [Methylomarinovum caldicuralii]